MLKELIESRAILNTSFCINRRETFRRLMANIIPENAAFIHLPDIQWDKNFYPYVEIDDYEFKLNGSNDKPYLAAKPICSNCSIAGGNEHSTYEPRSFYMHNPPASLVALLEYYPQPWVCDQCQYDQQQPEQEREVA